MGSHYDIRPGVLKVGVPLRSAENMRYDVESQSALMPTCLCLVTANSPKSYINAVEKLAIYFRREGGWDFPPFTAYEYSRKNYQRTNDKLTRSFLWYDAEEGHGGNWPTFGASTFRKKADYWELSWIWIHPYKRSRGYVRNAWPFFRSMFGLFIPSQPWSASLIRLMTKNGHLEKLKQEAERYQETEGGDPLEDE